MPARSSSTAGPPSARSSRSSLRNLEKGRETRFRPGVSGNPGGRPKKKPISDAIERHLHDPLEEALRKRLGLPKGATRLDGLAAGQIRQAITAAPSAVFVRESVEGRIPQPLRLTGTDDESFSLGVQPGDLAAQFEETNRILAELAEINKKAREEGE